jgi:hypothetical protein
VRVEAEEGRRAVVLVDGEHQGGLRARAVGVVEQEILEQIERLSFPQNASDAVLPEPISRTDGPDERGWKRNIKRALAVFSEGRLGKVVLARRTEFGFEKNLDAALLAGHPAPIVRQLGGYIAATAPAKYALVLRSLAADSDRTVRSGLARRLHDVQQAGTGGATRSGDDDGTNGDDRTVVTEVLESLRGDSRHSVRRAAA